jgi:hypothetical protein
MSQAVKTRGCAIGIAMVLALLGGALALVGPGLWRDARRLYAPISRIKTQQDAFESWVRQRRWRRPETPSVTPAQLEAFLAVRKELRAKDAAIQDVRRRLPEGEKPRLRDLPDLVSGVGGLVLERLEALRRHDLTPNEYSYVEEIVYGRWLAPLQAHGLDPAAREQAAAEIEGAAHGEADEAVRHRLEAVARALRAKTPPAPAGIPEGLHRLLLSRAMEIEEEAAPIQGLRRMQ